MLRKAHKHPSGLVSHPVPLCRDGIQGIHFTETAASIEKQVDSLLSLQSQLEGLAKTIQQMKESISKSGETPEKLALLEKMISSQKVLEESGEAICSSLNIQDSMPELSGVDPTFVQKLVTAHNLKIDI